MSALTAKEVPYPVGTDAAASLDTIVQSLAEWVDTNPGIAAMTTIARDALPAAGKWSGRVIYNTTTSALERYTGSVWVAVLVINSSNIVAGAVLTAAIADSNVTNAKLASGIDAAKLTTGTLPIARVADGAVTNAKLASGIDAAKLTTGTLPIARVADGAVTTAKLAASSGGTLDSGRLIYRKSVDGFVHVYSTAGGTQSGAFTLPSGFRPSVDIAFTAYEAGAIAIESVTTAGVIDLSTIAWFNFSFQAA